MIGYNFLQGSSWAERDFAARFSPRTHVVQGETKFAKDLLAQGNKVIFRLYNDDNPVNLNPTEFAIAAHNIAPAGAYIQLGNEPIIHNKQEALKFAKWTAKAQDVCHNFGRKCVIFNWSVLNPETYLWDYLTTPIQIAIGHNDDIGFHEYGDETNISGIGKCLQIAARFNGYFPNIVINEFGYSFRFSAYEGFRGHFSEDKYLKFFKDLYYNFYYRNNIDVALFSFNDWHGYGLNNTSITSSMLEIDHDHWNYGTLTNIPMTYVNIRSTKHTENSTNIVGRAYRNFGFKYQTDGDFYKIVFMNKLAFIHRQKGAVLIQ